MTALDAQSNLFPVTVEAPSISYPGARFSLERMGNRVTGSIMLDTPNPKRRRDCRVDYIRPKYWDDAHEAIALRVAGHWFKSIGGVVLLQKKQLGHIISRLRKGQSEQVMHWAVDAYADEPWHRERKAWTSMGRFFTGDLFDVWLERSPEYEKALNEMEQGRARQAQLKRRESALMRPRELADSCLRHHYRCATADQAKRDEAYERVGFESFKRLDPHLRSAFVRKRQFERRGSWSDRAYGGPMTMDNEHFASYVYSRALHDRRRREGVSLDAIMGIYPTTPYSLSDLHEEVERRALAGSGIQGPHDAIRHGRSDECKRLISAWVRA